MLCNGQALTVCGGLGVVSLSIRYGFPELVKAFLEILLGLYVGLSQTEFTLDSFTGVGHQQVLEFTMLSKYAKNLILPM
jgi:hypothetical protein